MRQSRGRPRQPFLTDKGEPRLRAVLTPSGPIEYRPGQAIIDLRRFDDSSDSPAQILERVGKLAGVALRTDDNDARQTARSRFLRVYFDPRVDVTRVIRQVEADPAIGPGAVVPNTVFRIGSFTADPMHFSGFGADPMHFSNSSTARPSIRPSLLDEFPRASSGPGKAVIAILDTGIPADGTKLQSDVEFVGIGSAFRDRADMNVDAYLDIAAGHTTFIRTIIQRASPAADVMVEGVIHNDGDGDEFDIANALQRVDEAVTDKSRLIVNLSFSGYYDGDVEPPLIAFWIRELVGQGAVVVAAAGNDGACRRKFPGAMPEVLAVGSLGPCGPSRFSNHGPWVDASAPGEDLVSEFFDHFDGAFEALVARAVPDIDDFKGWAMWSGTSFATPTVVGALAEIVEACNCPARIAVDKLLRRPGLYRLPDYGVIVNRIF
ncbi:MAG: S8/S53 family peptidase [Ilumatobacteraceae bacterium]